MVTLFNTPQINIIISYLSAFMTVFFCTLLGSLFVYQYRILNKGKKDKHILKRIWVSSNILAFMFFGFTNELCNRLSIPVMITVFFLIGCSSDKIIKGLFENGMLLKIISKFALKAKKDLVDSVTETISEEIGKDTKAEKNNHDK